MSRAEMCHDRRRSPARLTIPYAIRTHVKKDDDDDDDDDSLQILRLQFTIRDASALTLALRMKLYRRYFTVLLLPCVSPACIYRGLRRERQFVRASDPRCEIRERRRRTKQNARDSARFSPFSEDSLRKNPANRRFYNKIYLESREAFCKREREDGKVDSDYPSFRY